MDEYRTLNLELTPRAIRISASFLASTKGTRPFPACLWTRIRMPLFCQGWVPSWIQSSWHSRPGTGSGLWCPLAAERQGWWEYPDLQSLQTPCCDIDVRRDLLDVPQHQRPAASTAQWDTDRVSTESATNRKRGEQVQSPFGVMTCHMAKPSQGSHFLCLLQPCRGGRSQPEA